MTHYIRCVNRTESFGLAQAFAKHYSDRKPYYGSHGVLVKTDDHEFIFKYEGKPKTNEIKSEEFVKKYFGSRK